jgi:hypothetical protein
MRIDTPDDLRRTRQIVPYKQLLNLARNWGFTLREDTGGSHIRCTSQKYPDIVFNCVRKTGTCGSQLRLVEAMEQITARDLQKQQKIQSDFAAVSENRLAVIREKIPAHIIAEISPNGLVLLRDRNIPQIGVTLYSEAEDRLIENKIHNEIESLKREVFIALNRIHMEHDALPAFENGVFTGTINHEVYANLPALVIPDYTEDADAADILTSIDNYRKQIEEKDLDHAIVKEELLSRPFIGDIYVAFSSKRGDRSNYVKVSGERSSLNFSFHTYSNQRATSDDTNARISESDLQALSWKVARAENYFAKQAQRWERHVA